jgi:hypothetical protein
MLKLLVIQNAQYVIVTYSTVVLEDRNLFGNLKSSPRYVLYSSYPLRKPWQVTQDHRRMYNE